MNRNIMKRIDVDKIEKRAFINGKYVQAVNGEIIHKKSSIDGSDLSGLCACDEKDVDLAVKTAKLSYEKGMWSQLEPMQRKNIMLKLADLLEDAREELAVLDTMETGRCFRNYYYDSIPKAIEALKYFAEGIDKYYDVSIPPRKNSFSVITREPLGVVGIITPWNDPMVVATWKFAPALLMGNSVIAKPAEQSSFSLIRVAELAKQAGVPDGVFNVVPGFGEVAGKALALHKDVRGIFFTGSSEVGKKIIQYSGLSNMKKVGLECGGKSPFIVSKKCNNLEKAASVLAKNIFYNQGQICSAPSRVIIEKSVKDEFVEYLKNECEKYVPADPFDINSEVGCIVSKEQEDKIRKYIETGVKEGASIYTANSKNNMHPEACYINPTIFTDVDNCSTIAQEEIFGPVVTVIEAENIQDAVRIANNTRYGLAASIWTNDLDEAYQVSRKLQSGIVHINSYGDDDNMAPFGGVKESGIGKDKSVYAFDEYSVLKTTWMHFDDIL